MENQEQQDAVVKAAAKRMCEFLGEKGIRVKHTLMLEALAKGLGVDNWRALKATLDAPRAKALPVLPPLGVEQEWAVDALYRDNNQQFGERYFARTPREAAIFAMVERRTDCNLEIDVLNVYDANGVNHLSPSFVGEIELHANRAALVGVYMRVAALAAETLAPDALRARAWLKAVVDASMDNDLDELSDSFELEECLKGASQPEERQPSDPTEMLLLLCELGEKAAGGVVTFEAAHEEEAGMFYLVRALCCYFGEVVNSEERGLAGEFAG